MAVQEVDVVGRETLQAFMARTHMALPRLQALNPTRAAALITANLGTPLAPAAMLGGLGIRSLDVDVDWFGEHGANLDIGAASAPVGQSLYFDCVLPVGEALPANVNNHNWTRDFHGWTMRLYAHPVGGAPSWRYDGPAGPALRAFGNPTRDLLTYETAFNMPQFRRTNQVHHLGIFAISINQIRVWVRDRTPQATKKFLLEVFFPAVKEPEKLLFDRAYYDEWSWKAPPPPVIGRPPPRRMLHSQNKMFVDRNRTRVLLPGFALFPYNYRDNSAASRAIGSNPTTGEAHAPPFFRVEGRWDFWRTASRSTFARLVPLEPLRDGFGPAQTVYSRRNTAAWPHNEGDNERLDATAGNWNQLLPNNAPGYALQTRSAHDFGIKTGVNHIGTNHQPTKDTLEALNVRACLRSDYIMLVNARVGGNPAAEPGLKIQTELLTMTTRPVGVAPAVIPAGYNAADYFPAADGFQVRDLSIFDNQTPGRFYFPPLSMPYVDAGFADRQERWSDLQADPATWETLWRRIYARPVAEAKVLALLRYGLQHFCPHGQNLVLELDNSNPPNLPAGPNDITCGAAIIRDLGDVQLHTDVTTALWQDRADRPMRRVIDFEVPTPPSRGRWTQHGIAAPEALADTVYQSDHHTVQYGAGQVNLQWVTMSAIVRPPHIQQAQTGVATQGAFDIADYNPRWRQLLASMSALGIEHQRAFVECFERQLNVMLPQVDWSNYHDPQDWLALDLDGVGAAIALGDEDHVVEIAVGSVLHEFLRSAQGQAAVANYRTSQWTPHPPTATITVTRNGQPVPYARVRITPTAVAPQPIAAGMWVTPTAVGRATACACNCVVWRAPWTNGGYRTEVTRLFAKRDGVRWTDAQGEIRLYGPAPGDLTAVGVGGAAADQVNIT